MNSTPTFQATISTEEIMELPLKQFDGEVIIITEVSDIAPALEEINTHAYVGLDTETKPVFVKGKRNDVALVQISIPNKTFLFRINKTGITKGLAELFSNGEIKKLGVALRDDIKDLKKLHFFEPHGFIDLGRLVKSIGIENSGLRKLAGIILGIRISKSAQTSNWEAQVLTEKQIRYAATDSWVCLEIYNKLLELELI